MPRSTNIKGEVVRSGFEARITNELNRIGVAYSYEPFSIPFTPLKKTQKYLPDLVLKNNIIIEIKGRFTSADRQKHKALKLNYPNLDIRFVFQRASCKLNKNSNTTYAMWCRSNGFMFHEGLIPKSWVDEPNNKENERLIKEWLKR